MAAPESPPGRGLRHAFSALRHRDFALFWSGALASNVGTWMQQVTVPFVLFHLTGSAAWIGLGAFAHFFPMMAMNSVGGVLADRFSRKRIIMTTQSLQMGLAFALFALWQTDNARPGVLVAVMAVTGVVAGVQLPSWHSFVPQLVPADRLLNAVTLNSAQFNGARAVGPAIAGVVLATRGPGAAFLANACSYLFVLGALALVRPQPGPPASGGANLRREFADGVRYTRSQPGLVLAVVMAAVVGVMAAPVVQFTAVFARDVFEVGEAAYGLLTAAFGAGAVVGAVALGAYGSGVRRSKLVVVGVLALGCAAAMLGAAPVYAVGLLALLAMGGAHLVIAGSLNTAIQLIARDDMRGRATAVYMTAFTGSFPIGALLQGRMADAFGVQATVIGAGVLLGATGLYLLAHPALVGALDDGLSTDQAPASLPVAAAAS
ncbi:MAG: MFS transporter [Actinobacteria bacterium]|nr:MFS transporter [Actinomycetota bacterium]